MNKFNKRRKDKGKQPAFRAIGFGRPNSKTVTLDSFFSGERRIVELDNVPYLDEETMYYYVYDKKNYLTAKRGMDLYEVNMDDLFGQDWSWEYKYNPQLRMIRDLMNDGWIPFKVLDHMETLFKL